MFQKISFKALSDRKDVLGFVLFCFVFVSCFAWNGVRGSVRFYSFLKFPFLLRSIDVKE